MKVILFFLCVLSNVAMAQVKRPSLGNLPLQIGIDQVIPLRDELSKKSDVGNIEDGTDMPTDAALINTTTKQRLRVWIGQSFLTNEPHKKAMYVRLDSIYNAYNTWQWIEITTGQTQRYCYTIDSIGGTGIIKKTKSHNFFFRLAPNDQYQNGKRLIYMFLDSLKKPFNQHKSCYLYEYEARTWTNIDFISTHQWCKDYQDRSARQLYNVAFRQPKQAPCKPKHWFCDHIFAPLVQGQQKRWFRPSAPQHQALSFTT
jgi:hypothetical protein